MTIGDDIVARQGQRIAELTESLRLAVQQRNLLEDRNSTLAVRLRAAEASRDVAIGLVQRCHDSYTLLEVELRYARDMAKGILKDVTIEAPVHLENQRRVCATFTKALGEWLVTKDAPRKK